MKRIILLALFLSQISLKSFKPETYLINALGDKNKAMAESIASSLPDLDNLLHSNPVLEDAVEEMYHTVDAFKTAVAAKKSGGGASGVSKAEIEQLLKQANVTVPEIKSTTEAKAQLVNFFGKDQTGGKLLKEIGASDTQLADVQSALNKITTK